MRIVYQCEKCGAMFSGKPTSKLDCLRCEAQQVEPKYRIREIVEAVNGGQQKITDIKLGSRPSN